MQASDGGRLRVVNRIQSIGEWVKGGPSRREPHRLDTGDAGVGIECEWSRGVKIGIHSAETGLITLPDVPNGGASDGTDGCALQDLYSPGKVQSVNNARKRGGAGRGG